MFGFWPFTFDAEADVLTYSIVSLPSHGTLWLMDYDVDPSAISIQVPEMTINVTTAPFTVPFKQWALYWDTNSGSEDAGEIQIEAFDGKNFSAAGTFTIDLISVNNLPEPVRKTWETDEDTEIEITLYAQDSDSEFITLLVTDLPAHGKLYTLQDDGSRGAEVQQYGESWSADILTQYASDVHAVSTFWPSPANAENGCESAQRALMPRVTHDKPRPCTKVPLLASVSNPRFSQREHAR